jgi:hypothetical protein
LRRNNNFPDENPYSGSLRERVRHFIWRKIKSIGWVILINCRFQLFQTIDVRHFDNDCEPWHARPGNSR